MIFFDYGLLRKYRKAHGWRQADLAKRLHCAAATVSRWELGSTPITAEELAHIIDLCQVEDPGDFFVKRVQKS